MKTVFSWTSSAIFIWLYPENASMNVSNLCLAVESTSWSIRVPLPSFHLFMSVIRRSNRSLFYPLRSSSFLSLSPDFFASLMAATASLAFMYFCIFKSISAIVFEGFFASEATRSLDLNPTLKVVNWTLSSTSSTSRVSRVKRFTYDLRVSLSPCLMVSK